MPKNKTYTVTIKVTHYYDYPILASSKKEAKEIVLDENFCDDSQHDFIDWTSQKVDDVIEQKEVSSCI